MPKSPKTIIENRFYELPTEFPLLLLDGSRWRISDKKSDVLHFHNCLEIGLCRSDSGTVFIEDEALEFRAGDVTCIPRHIPHTTYSSPGKSSLWSYIFVNLNELLSEKYGAKENFDSFSSFDIKKRGYHYLISKNDNARIHFLVSAIVDELRGKSPDYRDITGAMFLTLYYEIRRIQAAAATETDVSSTYKDKLIIMPALNYICSGYMQNFSIEYLAALCHLSATHFRRVFQTIMGTTPLHYVNSIRIENACVLLQSTDESILTVSEQVGFRTVSSFNRCFLNAMGISPRDYRNALKHRDSKLERKEILKYRGWL